MKSKNEYRIVFNTLILALIACLCFTALAGCQEEGTQNATSGSSDVLTSPDTTPSLTTPSVSDGTTTVGSTTAETTTAETTTVTEPLPSTPQVTTLPTPETTVLPAPIATEGSFSMDTGTTLNFRVDWSLDKFEDGYAYIDVKIVLDTYEIHVSPRKNLGIINFGEETIRYSTDRISYTGKKPTEIILTLAQIAIPADGDIAVTYLEGRWFFNGNYARVDYGWLTAGGYVCVQKPQ